MTTASEAAADFQHALLGQRCWLELENGTHVELPVAQWHNSVPDAGDELMLARCAGSTLDIGCGPGRLTTALTRRGIDTLGIDISPAAVELTTRRGARAACRDVFSALPETGSWEHALLADGNIGIGGDPHALLRRIAGLLRPRGTVLTEVESRGDPLHSTFARLVGNGQPSRWFRWAWLGVESVTAIARDAGMYVDWVGEHDGRFFAELVTAERYCR